MTLAEAITMVRALVGITETTTKLPDAVLTEFVKIANREIHGRLIAMHPGGPMTLIQETTIGPDGNEATLEMFASVESVSVLLSGVYDEGTAEYQPLTPIASTREVPSRFCGQKVDKYGVDAFYVRKSTTNVVVGLMPFPSGEVAVLVTGQARSFDPGTTVDLVTLGILNNLLDESNGPMLVVYRACQLAKIRLGEDPAQFVAREEEAWLSFEPIGSPQNRLPPVVRNESW
jgi:hypothetical protein